MNLTTTKLTFKWRRNKRFLVTVMIFALKVSRISSIELWQRTNVVVIMSDGTDNIVRLCLFWINPYNSLWTIFEWFYLCFFSIYLVFECKQINDFDHDSPENNHFGMRKFIGKCKSLKHLKTQVSADKLNGRNSMKIRMSTQIIVA